MRQKLHGVRPCSAAWHRITGLIVDAVANPWQSRSLWYLPLLAAWSKFHPVAKTVRHRVVQNGVCSGCVVVGIGVAALGWDDDAVPPDAGLAIPLPTLLGGVGGAALATTGGDVVSVALFAVGGGC